MGELDNPSSEERVIEGLKIYLVRGYSIVLDSDLASVYGVETRVFNQAFRRNQERFPADFAFELTKEEWGSLRSQFVILKAPGRGQHRKYLPWAFTEHGALMAATILNSAQAIAMSIYVVRAFVKMRMELTANAAILKRLAEIEKALLMHDGALYDLYQKLLPLLQPVPEERKPRIGFHAD
jgi:ORF6N domain